MVRGYLHIEILTSMVNKIKNGIVFIKTSKCGTETVSHHLNTLANSPLFRLKTTDEQGIFPEKGYVNLQHIQWSDINYDLVKLENRAIISCVRNPLTRMMSHYRHLRDSENRYQKYGSDFGSWYAENYHNTNLEKGYNGLDNYLSKYMGIYEISDIDKYDFIFVLEKIDYCVIEFTKQTGIEFKPKLKNKAITNDRLLINRKQINLFEKNNKLDYDIYNHILINTQ